MKTKEEILDNQRHGFNEGQRESALYAMSEYAKQQAIAFEVWKIKEGWVLSSNPLHDPDARVYYQPTEETDWLSVKELYDLFESQNKGQ
jgi:hypothetical protein